jgi:hypothetical protein
MYEVNRSVAILRPKQPYLDWLRRVPSEEPIDVSLDELRRDATAVLIPACDSPEEALDYVYRNYESLFEMELGDWHQDEKLWPNNRSLRMFLAWFDVQVHPFVLDVVDDEDTEEGSEGEANRSDGETLH